MNKYKGKIKSRVHSQYLTTGHNQRRNMRNAVERTGRFSILDKHKENNNKKVVKRSTAGTSPLDITKERI